MFVLAALMQAAIAPPAAAPAHPTSSTEADCFPLGPFIVFFDRNSARLEAEALAVLELTARYFPVPCNGGSYRLVGHAERGETRAIDRRRVAVVRDWLRQRGLARFVVHASCAGAGSPRVAHARNALERRQNRRVVIEPVYR